MKYLLFPFIRYEYTVELVEPDTPWRENAYVLSRKNSHMVQLEKIQMMLEKQRVFINMQTLIDDCRRKLSFLNSITDRICKLEKIIILMRGVPGSGKSYLAHQIKGRGTVLSTDDYFYDRHGYYIFNPTLLSEAHDWNRRRTERKMKDRINPIIIDNTNLETWEIEPYIHLALRFILFVLLFRVNVILIAALFLVLNEFIQARIHN